MQSLFSPKWVKSALTLIFTFLGLSISYSQNIKAEKKIDEAITYANSGNYDQAIPILEKYAHVGGFEEFRIFQINVYLNWCYWSKTENLALDFNKVNSLADSYIVNYGVSKTDRLRSIEEMKLLFMVGLMNKSVDNIKKEIFYLSQIQKHYEERRLPVDETYALILNQLTAGFHSLSNYRLAIESAQKTCDVYLEIFGEKSKEFLSCLSNLGTIFSDAGEYQKEFEIKVKAYNLSKEILGEDSPEYLTHLNNLAGAYNNLGNYQKSFEIILEVVKLEKEVLGEKNEDYLLSLNNLSTAYRNIGDYQNSLKIILEFLELQKEIHGEKHPDFILGLNDLAIAYNSIGDNKKALVISLDAVELVIEVLGEENETYSTVLSTLASIYSDQADYLKALEIYLNVIDLESRRWGENHPQYLNSLSNLALVYSNLGDYQKALDIYLKVVELKKGVLGEINPYYFSSLNNLASVYSDLGNDKEALEIYQNIVNLSREVLGEKHPDHLSYLSNLAFTNSNLGEYKKALEINLKVIERRKEILGEKHPDYLVSLNNLASNYNDLGDYDKALEINLKDLELRKEVLGEKHPRYALSLSNIANTEYHLGKSKSSLNHFLQVIYISKERVIGYLSWMTENQREVFWNLNKNDFLLFPFYLEEGVYFSPELVDEAYNTSLLIKSLLLNTTLSFDKLIRENATPEAISKYEELKLLKLQIQSLNEKPIAERYLNLDSLETLAQKLETELVKLSKEYGDYTQNLKITWKEVQSNLGDNDVAIEFLEYPTLTDTVKYAALVLRKGWSNPEFIPLFRKDQIDELIKLDKNQIYSNGFVGKEIRKLIWNPLEEFILPGEQVYFSAAGILHQLAIENLAYDESATLGDRYQIFRLSSTKDLALQRSESKTPSIALYGGIQYDLEIDKMMVESKKYQRTDTFYSMRGMGQDSTSRNGWQFLPGTLAEANEVSRILSENQYQVTEYIGEIGSEESFKDLSGKKPGILHVATHGFFLPIEESKRNRFMQMRLGDEDENRGYVDPMLRSGLMLSGGNRAWMGDSIPDNIEDGILTAREISHLDLRGTDLVVLSACETGLGDVSSEGVFGLQRSFKQAGAQTIIMSLWNVKDEATKYLMTNFYTYLMQGMSKRDAFILARNKCRTQYQDPASWAAFIMLD